MLLKTVVVPEYTEAMSAIPYVEGLEEYFSFQSTYAEGKTYLGVRRGPWLMVPRNCAPLGQQDRRSPGSAIPAFDCKLKPRDADQQAFVAKAVSLLQEGESFVGEAPTGFGKTFCGTMIAAHMGLTTMIVVTKSDLMDSWYKALILAGVPADKIGKVQGPTCTYKGKWFVLSMVQTLIKQDKLPDELYGWAGLTIFDETHRMAADTFSIACTLIRSRLRLGLSATPKRKDGKTPVIDCHIGPVRVRGTLVPMKGKVLVKQTGWAIPRRKKIVEGEIKEVPMPHAPGRMASVYKAMAKSEPRNAIISSFVKQSYDVGRTVLILGDMIDDQLMPMFHRLGKSGIPGEDMGFYISGKKPHELQFAANRRVILATFGMASEGTDFPVWDTLILLNPRSDVKQAFGRILRTKEGKRQPVMLDLVDVDRIFQNMYRSREVQYYSVGAEIVKL